MATKFVIFAMCATMVQSSLATLLSTSTSETKTEFLVDFSLLAAYEKITALQFKKSSENLFSLELEGYSAKANGQNKNVVKNLASLKTCETEVVDPLIGALDAILAGIAIVDGKAASDFTVARVAAIAALGKLVGGICSAFELAVGPNEPGVLAKIEAIRKIARVGIVIFDAGNFATLQSGRVFDAKSQSAIKRAEAKSISELTNAVDDIFDGIQILASVGTEVEKEDTVSAIKTTLDRQLYNLFADTKTKFNLFFTLSTADWMIQYGDVPHSVVIKTIKESMFSDYEKGVNENSPKCGEE